MYKAARRAGSGSTAWDQAETSAAKFTTLIEAVNRHNKKENPGGSQKQVMKDLLAATRLNNQIGLHQVCPTPQAYR